MVIPSLGHWGVSVLAVLISGTALLLKRKRELG
ncbi:MAG: IPTL-CTERM sorting domain-containing protein [Deltaproteobacteria bacterium]|nr:IPTL-CTERM sorting domain-containing protein [Deltaproteobacteria bacterium]